MKRICTLLMALVLVVLGLTLLPTEAEAASQSDLTFTWNSDGKNYYVSDCRESASGSLTIPATYNGAPVTSIASYAFQNCDSLTSITLPDSVISIGDSAFSRCSSLTSITIPDSVTSIGDYAFYKCTSLTSVTIPDSVTRIGSDVFSECTKLSVNTYDNALYLGNASNPYCLLLSTTNKQITSCTIHPDTKMIASSAFYDCTSLTSVTTGNSVTSIGNEAFYNCTSLTSVTIPDSVTRIGNYAFRSCTSLTSITIPDSVTSIGNSAFYNCTSLTSVTIPDSVTSIGNSAFYNCTSLTSVTIPDSVTSIGNSAFYNCTSLTSVTIPDSVTSIGDSTFESCTSLTSITIPDSVTSIGSAVFSGCTKLPVNTYDNALYLGNVSNPYWLLLRKTNKQITSCTIHPDTKMIADSAFYNCTSLTSVTIPDSVTNIGDNAFRDCTSLASVTFSNSIQEIHLGSFYNCKLYRVSLPCSTEISDGFTVSVEYNSFDTNVEITRFHTYDLPTLPSICRLCKYDLNDLKNATLSVSSCVFDGTAQTPSVVVKMDGKTLKENTDYVLCYSNNSQVGIGTVRAYGIGKYTGYAVADFTIGSAYGSFSANVRNKPSGTIYNCNSFRLSIDEKLFFSAYLFDSNGNAIDKDLAGSDIRKEVAVGSSLMTPGTYTLEYFYYTSYKTVVRQVNGVYTYVYEPSGTKITGEYTIIIDKKSEEIKPDKVSPLPAKEIDPRTLLLQVSTEPQEASLSGISWSSSNSSVATVSNGIVTLHKAGNVTITAKVNGKYATWNLTIDELDISNGECLTYNSGNNSMLFAYNGKLLKAGTDYTVSFAKNNNVLDITISGCGVFGGQQLLRYDANTGKELPFIITFKNADGTIIKTAEYFFGDMVALPTAPQRPGNVDPSYVFKGWDKTTTVCLGDAVYTAVFAPPYPAGDIDCNLTVTSDDVVKLLLHISMPDLFPIDAEADFTGDGKVTSDDVVKLLLHISMPDLFPLETTVPSSKKYI